jgi:NTP pyrophosphatase (non-canonical NTP hydrolase)
MSDISELQKKVVAFRDARDWEQFHNPKDLAVSLLLEAAEFLEHFQWKSSDEIKQHLETKGAAAAEELADVFYWVLLIAHDMDMDLEKEFERKMAQNEAKYPISAAKGNHKKYTELK